MIEIHAYHGWGFDASFWENIQKDIPRQILFKTADRGYFGQPNVPDFENISTSKVLFAHSFGLHLVPVHQLHSFDVVIIFNGFLNFIAEEPLAKRRELKILNRMIAQFERYPKEVLTAFYTNCFFPNKTPSMVFDNLDNQLLLADLIHLRDSKLQIGQLNAGTIVLSGSKDKIMPSQRSKELADYLEGSLFKVMNDQGHALPIVNSSECWSFLSGVVPIFGAYAERNESK